MSTCEANQPLLGRCCLPELLAVSQREHRHLPSLKQKVSRLSPLFILGAWVDTICWPEGRSPSATVVKSSSRSY
eukprot:2814607-Pyramimonas_sp.AAC.1